MARLFFALWPDPGARETLAEQAGRLAAAGGGRAVPAARLHLTLVFLGEVEPARIPAARRGAERAEGRAFTVRLDRIGHFPGARVTWAGCSAPPKELLELQASLTRELAAEGFAPEARRYAPHLTLVRRGNRPDAGAGETPVAWRATQFALVESLPGGGYRSVAQWALAEGGGETKPRAA